MTLEEHLTHHSPCRIVFTARCYAERGYATACRLSVCPSVCDVQVSWSHRGLEYFENNFTAEGGIWVGLQYLWNGV